MDSHTSQNEDDNEQRYTDEKLITNEEESEISFLQKRLAEKYEIIRKLKTKVEKVNNRQEANQEYGPSVDNDSIRNPLPCKNVVNSKSKTNVPFIDDSSQHTSLSSNVSLKSARPPLGALQLKNNNEEDLNQKLRKKVSELSKEVNKWRIKATLLVEKKNKARLLSRENSDLKKKVKEFKEKLKSMDGYESPIPSPMPKVCPTTRCIV